MKLAACALACLAGCTTQDNLGNHVFGQTRWSIAIGGPGDERATAVTVDPIGNVIVAGRCAGDIDFGSGPLPCQGAFISQRASQTGDEQWTVRLDGAAVDSLGYVNDSVVAVGAKSVGAASDQFVSIFDAAGQLRSTSSLGLVGTVLDPVGTAASDGCIFTTGGFNGQVPSNEVITNPPGDVDAYVTAHWPDASLSWSASLHGDGYQLGTAIVVTPDSYIAVLVDASGPFTLGGRTISARSYPATVLVRLTPTGVYAWSRTVPDHPRRLGVSSTGDMIVAGCPTTRAYTAAGTERWSAACNSADAIADALDVSADGTIVVGGHHEDPSVADGELFLDAYDADGHSVGAARTAGYSDPTDSQIAATAIEPSGEIVFTATASHGFDFGLGMLPHAGLHDIVVVKLDSFAGRDGPVVLAREAP